MGGGGGGRKQENSTAAAANHRRIPSFQKNSYKKRSLGTSNTTLSREGNLIGGRPGRQLGHISASEGRKLGLNLRAPR